jgi:hypothetical protein
VITLQDYFGRYAQHPDARPGMWSSADDLLGRVNELKEWAKAAGIAVDEIDADTGSEISGSSVASGGGNGGFRPQDCPVGAPDSAHKQACALDDFDPSNALDNWISEFDENDGRKNVILEKFGLYREHPDATPGWCHLTTRRPGSGKRTYRP